MSELWYRKLGFYNNPFSIKPGAYDIDLVAYDMDSIYQKIDNAEMLFIEGEYGTGKTTMLKNIIAKYKGKNRIIYYSFNSEKEFDLNALLKGADSFWRKITGISTKNIIMLLDEVHLMKSNDAKKLLKPYKDGKIKSVVFVSHDYNDVSFPEEIKPMLNGNVLRTIELTPNEAVDLVKRRIGDIDVLPPKIIKKIYNIADKNPRRLLEYCEDLMRYVVEVGDKKATDYHVNEVFGNLIRKKEKKIQKIEQMSKEEAHSEKKMKNEREIKQEIKQEIKNEIKNDAIEQHNEKPEKKYKINKLVSEDKKNTLGTIEQKEESIEQKQESEYKIYFMDEEQ